MLPRTETQGTTPQNDLPPHERTTFEPQSGSIPSVIRGWHARPTPWQVQFTSPAGPTPSQTGSPTASQTAIKITRASPLTTEDDLKLLRIAVNYKDRFTTLKGNAVLYEAIAEVWRADTGRNVNHQTVHKHITDRLKEHSAIIATPETARPKMNATEAAIFDVTNEIYQALQEKIVAEERRKALAARADAQVQTHTDSVRNDVAGGLVQRVRDKRPRDPEISTVEESERPTARPRTLPPSPAPSTPSLQTEMALFLRMMNSRAAIEASDGAKKEDITRLEARIDSMAATMEGIMALLQALTQRPPRSN
ncbi:hypothetical protein PITC_046650 [Penicillium italicum]|uniref:Uncharacterized protein n=1 Tax=Penicillium italicum TaxID=40296 RepID=A0A0A2KKE8_PENIT|nr:hypothetical protein PITC_046650 [Penicillium italicum]